MCVRKTPQQVIDDFRKVHGDTYDYSPVIYQNTHSAVTIICPVHGEFVQKPVVHLRGSGCPCCAATRRADLQRHDTRGVIAKFRKIHGNVYDYSSVDYRGSKETVTIICKDHGPFDQRAGDHLHGSGCVKCINEIRRTDKLRDGGSIIDQFQEVHGDTYDYSLVDYSGIHQRVDIICRLHGPYSQRVNDHLQGCGCPICGNANTAKSRTLPSTKIIEQFREAHGDTYDYSSVVYINGCSKVCIGCKTHGIFRQTPRNHKNGQGCPKCVNHVSKPANAWLDSLGIPDDPDHREIRGLIANNKYTVDGYDPDTKTVYEFHGDYWHGNPKIYESSDINPSVGKTYGQLYQNTLNKKYAYVGAGFKYVEMWESDWNKIFDHCY